MIEVRAGRPPQAVATARASGAGYSAFSSNLEVRAALFDEQADGRVSPRPGLPTDAGDRIEDVPG